jgi:GH25 family lysozyme M1 (1,4-beta-N-acetylmuramidase)
MEDTILSAADPAGEAPAVEEPQLPAAREITAEDPEEISHPKIRKKLYGEHYLAIIAGVLALITLVLTLLSLPYMLAEVPEQPEDPQALLQGGHQATMPPVPETEPPVPTEPKPQPEKNPYGRLDFQYEGRYLGCVKAGTMPGIDVSYYQGDIDWEKVASSGIQFAMVRLGYRGYGEEGKLVEDKLAFQNIEGALDAGLKVGIYFFSQAITVEEAVEEAEFVLKRIEKYDITMPIVYDWEYISAESRTGNVDARLLTDCTKAFCERIQQAGYEPMIYFNADQSHKQMYLEELTQYPFWLAMYESEMDYPYKIDMWQYSCTGTVPGIEGNVDLNLYFHYE